jgi:outer membrane lipoprotein-sorting protein
LKNFIRGILVFYIVAGAVALNAQAPTPAPQAPATTAPAPAATAAPDSAPAPTADEIVQKHLAAIGGKDAISQVKSLSMQASVQVMGNEAPSTTVIVDGVGYKTETEFNGMKIVSCFNDKGGWSVNPMMGASDPTPMPDDQYNSGKDNIYMGGALYDYAAKGSKVELLSTDAAGNTYKIKLTTKENIESVYVIDAKTYLIKSMTTKGKFQDQNVDMTSTFSDYRKLDTGYLMPYTIDLDFGGQFSLSIAVKKVELNPTIDPTIFAMPKPEPKPAAKTGGE